jgi:hypothetical protein
MSESTSFDLPAAHRHFSAHCFNTAWDLIDKPDRTPEEDLDMLHRGISALWHWTQRPDCTATNRSIGLWQVSRIYAILGQADNAHRYAGLCLKASSEPDVEPFYLAYAHEALARADMVAGKMDKMQKHLGDARQIAEQLTPDQETQNLLKDLATIGQASGGRPS